MSTRIILPVTLTALVALAIACSKGSKPTDPPEPPGSTTFQWVSRLTINNNWFGVFVDNGSKLLAIGRHVYYSTNGQAWTMTPGFGDPLDATDNLRVVWTGSQYVAVTGASIFRSADGSSWQNAPVAAPGRLRGIAHSPSVTVIVGDSGAIFSSPNGVTWSPHSLSNKVRLRDVAWSGQQFYAVGDAGTIVSSPDGGSWTSVSSPTSSVVQRVAHAGSRLFLYGDNQFFSSPDGVTWNQTNAATLLGQSFQIYGIAWSGTAYTAAAMQPGRYGGPVCLRSPNGVTWSIISELGSCTPTSISWSGSRFVLTTRDGSILTSPDAVSWSIALAGRDCSLTEACRVSNGYIAVGGNTYALSLDGVTWQHRLWSRPAGGVGDVASSGSTIVATIGRNRVMVSPDGINWQAASIGDSTYFPAQVAWSGTQFVAIGRKIHYDPNPVIDAIFSATSVNGLDWTIHNAVLDPQAGWVPTALEAGNSTLIAGFVYHSTSRVARSVDGVTWATVNDETFHDLPLYDVTWGNGKYLVCAGLGVLLESTDGQNWTRVDVKVGYKINQVVSAAAYTYLFFDDGVVLRSTDRRIWSVSDWQNNLNVSLDNASVIWVDDTFLATGRFSENIDSYYIAIMTSIQASQ